MITKIMLFGYIILTTILALTVVKQNKTARDMFVAKSSLGIFVIIPLVISETIGGAGTVGDAAEAMTKLGLAAMWSIVGLGLGCLCFALVFGSFYRVLGTTRGVMSVPSAYEIMFDKKTKIVMLIIVSVVYSCLFALQPVAASGILAPAFGIERELLIAVMGIFFIVIACFGGLKGLASMNRVHCFFMYFGLLLVVVLALRQLGGVESVKLAAPAEYFNPFNPGVFTVMIWVVGTVLSQMSSAIMATTCLSGKTLKDVQYGVLIACIIMITFSFLPPLIGICAKVMMPEIHPQMALYLVANEINVWVGGIATVAVAAAIFSTAPVLLLIVGTTLAQDLYKGCFRPNANDREVILFARLAMILIGVVSVYFGANTGSLFSQMISTFQIRSIAAVVLLVALFWPRVTSQAAFWSITIGGGLAAIWHFAGHPFGMAPLVVSLPIGLLILFGLTLKSPERISKGHLRYLSLKDEYERIKVEEFC